MISPATKRSIYRILPFGIIWLVFGFAYSLIEKGLLGEIDYYPSTGNPYEFEVSIFVSLGFMAFIGILFGAFEILYMDKVFLNKSFGKKIVFKTLIYVVLMIVFLVLISLIGNFTRTGSSLVSKAIWDNVWVFFSNFAFWSVLFYMGIVIVITLFYAEVSVNLGWEVLNNFFTGKYHTPIEEERIFMFLDMKSSTTIAEQLGHIRYFEMLKSYYADLSAPVIKYGGEIYQYVGDELVVSWKMKNGTKDHNCIRCFFAMKAAIHAQAATYESKFGQVPAFKAGFHSGRVTTGEIGVIKKDIIFTGDVLNTTARIQGLCNPYEVDLLISAELVNQLNLNESDFQLKSMGENELRGREQKLELFTIWPQQEERQAHA